MLIPRRGRELNLENHSAAEPKEKVKRQSAKVKRQK
jgi:hypothetical protein